MKEFISNQQVIESALRVPLGRRRLLALGVAGSISVTLGTSCLPENPNCGEQNCIYAPRVETPEDYQAELNELINPLTRLIEMPATDIQIVMHRSSRGARGGDSAR